MLLWFNSMVKHKSFQKILESYNIIFRFMFSGRMFHSAAEEYLIVMLLLCTGVVVEADLNGLVGMTSSVNLWYT